MKKNLAKKVTLSILAGAVLMSSNVVWAMRDPSSDPGSAPKYWGKLPAGYVRLPENNELGDVSLVINDYGSLDPAEAFYGAVSFDEDGPAENGIVTINVSIGDEYTFTGGICGGAALLDAADAGSDANNNKVSITTSKATIKSDVYGGYSDGGSVEKNSVTIEAGTFSECYIEGGSAYGGYAEEHSATVTGGTFSDCIIRGGSAYDGYAEGNSVTITGGTFSDSEITGGYSKGGYAKGNSVTVTGGTFSDCYIEGEFSDGSNAEGNSVTITGGTFSGEIVGGCSDGGNAEGNSVTITGGTFSGEITGGSSRGGNVKNNIITISGSADFANASLIGGVSSAISTFAGGPSIGGGEVSGNTLNIGTDSSSWSGKIKSIRGFNSINFNNIAWNNDGTVVQTTNLELNDTTITANIKSGTLTEENEMMNLIETENAIVGSIATTGNTVNVGIAESYEGVITQEDKAIVITLTGTPTSGDTGNEGTGDEGTGNTTPQPSRNDQVLVLGESRAAAVAFTNQGSELIETGLNALARDNEKDTKVFAAVYGNHSEYETGSHVNVNGWSGIVGIGKTNADGLTVGAFFENGEGNYSTHNIFTNDYIRGDGEACYNGGGFLVRKDNANGVYAEASLRAGNLQNELRNAVRNGSELTGYDIDTFYYGAHVGIGKVIARGNDGDSIDVYGKFIYTHHDGETFDIGGTATKFDSVESERLRLGFRINEVQTNKLSMYYGAAWEYEFNGDAHDKIASFDLETPSLEGSTVIGEIGAYYKASEKWSIDLNGRAYVGQREGFSGSVQANYAF